MRKIFFLLFVLLPIGLFAQSLAIKGSVTDISGSPIPGVSVIVDKTSGIGTIKDIDAKDIETVYLYVNKTKFVDFDARVADAALAAGDIVDMNSISLSLTIPELVPTQNYVFARVGVKIAGVEDLLFSAVEKVNL